MLGGKMVMRTREWMRGWRDFETFSFMSKEIKPIIRLPCFQHSFILFQYFAVHLIL